MQKYITITPDGTPALITHLPDGEPPTPEMLALGYLPADESAPPPSQDTEHFDPFLSLETYYIRSGDTYRLHYRWTTDPFAIREEISRLQDTLASTDYIFTKMAEYSLIPNPTQEQAADMQKYDISSLHITRQALRDQITTLRNRLNPHHNATDN